MKIPDQFKAKIDEDYRVQAWVYATISDFDPWLRNSNFVFFKDYTQHKIEHVEQVLDMASSIIHTEAWGVVTPTDVGLLIVASLLHDCAMHLTEDGFQQLIDPNSYSNGIKEFNDRNWSELWRDFSLSVKRLDDFQRQNLFGSTEIIGDLPSNSDKWNDLHKKVIGEFLRRHHPRLAHEIALFGVPGSSKNRIQLPSNLDDELKDLAGLIARSHGISLRDTFDYLKKIGLWYSGKTHAVFLMALLRIADYLQIHAERAPSQILQVKRIRSPISDKEWKVHNSIMEIHSVVEDSEAVFVQTKHSQPDDVETYLRLKEWLDGIQNELDICWAVFGEVYSRKEPLNQLGLKIRRINSNIYERQFAENINYIPERVAFSVDRGEVLSLLVKPLYGDKPECGIRELIQNAVDAVRELEYFLRGRPQELEKVKKVKLLGQDADVVVWLHEPDKDGTAKLIISDRGIGMTKEVITKYFLKVGATFRKSDLWAREFEASFEERAEQVLKSRVLRSGRFGVGVLAAFLLGDKIKVETLHIDSKVTGLCFEARLDSEAIELRHKIKQHVGTTVEIDISKEKYEKLSEDLDKWDWYCCDRPKVVRLIGKDQKVLQQGLKVPEITEECTDGWHTISTPGFKSVHWRQIPLIKSTQKDLTRYTYLICNGILYGYDINLKANELLSFTPPSLNILDPDGITPFDLSRSSVSLNNSTLETILTEELVKYFFAFLLLTTPTYNDPKRFLLLQPKQEFFSYVVSPWMYTRKGLTICEQWNIHNLDILSSLIVIINPKILDFTLLILDSLKDKYDSILSYNNSSLGYVTSEQIEWNALSVLYFFEDFLDGNYTEKLHFKLFGISSSNVHKTAKFKQKGMRLLISSRVYEEILRDEFSDLESINQVRIEKECSTSHFILLKVGECPSTRFDLELIDRQFSIYKPTTLYQFEGIYAAEIFPCDMNSESTPKIMSRLWQDIICEPTIPFDETERRSKLPHAFEALASYIEEHRDLKDNNS